MKNLHYGFSSVELIASLVIIGMLAAITIPKFASLESANRITSLKSILSNIQTATQYAHELAVVEKQDGNNGKLLFNGHIINLINGYPAASKNGIVNSLLDANNYKINQKSNGLQIKLAGHGATHCNVEYQNVKDNHSFPTISVETEDC